MAEKTRDAAIHLERSVGLAHAAAVFAIVAIGQAVSLAHVPDVAARGAGKIAIVVIVNALALGVSKRPVASDVVGVVGHRGPRMAVSRDVAVAIEVVEQDEFVDELMVV